jgi:hypothetical protein
LHKRKKKHMHTAPAKMMLKNKENMSSNTYACTYEKYVLLIFINKVLRSNQNFIEFFNNYFLV